MRLGHLDSLFWAAGLLGHAVLLCILWFRHRAGRFPIFTALIAASVVRTVVLYFLLRAVSGRSGYSYSYFYTYWTFALLDVALQLAVIYEMASHIFRPLGVWVADVRNGFFWLICVSILIALGLTWIVPSGLQSWRQLLVIRGSFFSSALMGELFVGMIALSVTIGLPWRTHVARITQGLGIYSLVCLLEEAGDSYFGLANGTTISMVLTHVRMGVYLMCLVYWIVTLWQDEPAPRQLPDELRRHISLLRMQTAYDLQRFRGRRD